MRCTATPACCGTCEAAGTGHVSLLVKQQRQGRYSHKLEKINSETTSARGWASVT